MNLQKMAILFAATLGSSALVAQSAVEVARVNNRAFTQDELNRRFQENQQLFRFKPTTRRGVLEDMINRELGIQEARKLNLEQDPQVRDRIETVLYTAYVERVLAERFRAIQVTPAEIRSYYARNPTIRTSHILVKVNPGAPADQQKAAEARIKMIQEQVRAGKKSFEDLAKEFSDGPSAPVGGDVDFHTKDELDPAYYRAAIALKKGQVSAPVRSQFGWHLIKLTDIRDAKDADQQKYRALIFDEKRTKIFEDFFADLRKRNRVQINEAALR